MPVSDVHSVLLVEDDPIIAKTLSMGLRYQGFELTVAPSVGAGLAALNQESFKLIMLDVMLPDGSGIELCRSIRAQDAQIPILLITARTDEKSAIAGIDGGADDYIRKPFGMGELVARLNRLVTRTYKSREVLVFGSLHLDLNRRTANVGEKALSLGKREYDMLALLMRAQGDTVTRDALLGSSGYGDDTYDRTIDSHLSHIRRKLKGAGSSAAIIAIYGVGYRLEAR
jgi:DNA-binding response OmpR family regulator